MTSAKKQTNQNSFNSKLTNTVVRPQQFLLWLFIGIVFTGTFILASAFSVSGQMTDQSNKIDKNEQAILALANDYANAVVKKDVAAIDRLLTDDYLEVFSPKGTVGTKSELIQSYKTPSSNDVKLEAIDITNPKVRLYGNTAIQIAGLTLRYKMADGKAVSYDFTASIVAIKEKEQWKIASFIASYIQPQKPETEPAK